jgi:hypothetical protein
VALRQAGAISENDPIYKRGLEVLRKTQLEDGSWHVRTRAVPLQPLFPRGFPHQRDEWISATATPVPHPGRRRIPSRIRAPGLALNHEQVKSIFNLMDGAPKLVQCYPTVPDFDSVNFRNPNQEHKFQR